MEKYKYQCLMCGEIVTTNNHRAFIVCPCCGTQRFTPYDDSCNKADDFIFTAPEEKESTMKECKILTFHNASHDTLKDADAQRQLKMFGVHYTESRLQAYNNYLCDHPVWEKELNSYLQSGWTLQSMTSVSPGTLAFLLVR